MIVSIYSSGLLRGLGDQGYVFIIVHKRPFPHKVRRITCQKEQTSPPSSLSVLVRLSSVRHASSTIRARRQDRKRVVEGKRVSVRVALGGRRVIKKKTKNK